MPLRSNALGHEVIVGGREDDRNPGIGLTQGIEGPTITKLDVGQDEIASEIGLGQPDAHLTDGTQPRHYVGARAQALHQRLQVFQGGHLVFDERHLHCTATKGTVTLNVS